jgi:uncharacterized membrane protein YgdD (TMEM256/DUF423 family)
MNRGFIYLIVGTIFFAGIYYVMYLTHRSIERPAVETLLPE